MSLYCRSFGVVTLSILGTAVGSAQAGPISIAMVTVGDPGNAPSLNGEGGAVAYSYSIGKYDATTAQYAAFLNAVAATDSYGLWNKLMGSTFPTAGISQNGSSGSYAYAAIGNGNMPIFDVTWGSAARFVNWLQNGQPDGAEGPGTTETGAYTLNGATSVQALMAVTRNPGATWFLPTEDEWLKAAYYKGGGLNAGYWLYPTQNNNTPSNVLSATGTNNANFRQNGYTDPTNFLTSVGAFAASPGPYGTFDQGGDVFQWNETAVAIESRGNRGGSFGGSSFLLRNDYRGYGDPTDGTALIGFRVGSVPEPSSVILLVAGIVTLIVASRRRPRR